MLQEAMRNMWSGLECIGGESKEFHGTVAERELVRKFTVPRDITS